MSSAYPEFYVSKLYDRYLKLGLPILMLVTENFKAMGSPGQLLNYWGIDTQEMQSQNRNSHFKKMR